MPLSHGGSANTSSSALDVHPFKNHAGQTPLHIAIEAFSDKIGKGQCDDEQVETVSAIIDDAKVYGPEVF